MDVSILASTAIYIGSFALFCLATFIGGLFQIVAQSFRFAATDTASPAFRPKAISWVMAGGVFAGVKETPSDLEVRGAGVSRHHKIARA